VLSEATVLGISFTILLASLCPASRIRQVGLLRLDSLVGSDRKWFQNSEYFVDIY